MTAASKPNDEPARADLLAEANAVLDQAVADCIDVDWPALAARGLTPEEIEELRQNWLFLRQLERAFPRHARPRAALADDVLEKAATATPPQIPNYEIFEEIARGGMGVVYKALQQGTERTVALKVIRADKLSSLAAPDRIKWFERFQAEARTVARLDHPHIVPLFEAGVHEGQPYFSMLLMEGTTLADRVGDSTPSSGQSRAESRTRQWMICQVMETVVKAVHYAHVREGVVHLDLKPGNILFDQDGSPRVSDFGLARRLEAGAETIAATSRGTIPYMAPEHATDGHGSREADIYSLGAILYELLTGSPPKPWPEEQVWPATLNPAVDVDLDCVCRTAMAKDRTARYPSADAMAEDLARFMRGEPLKARPVGTVERAWKWCRRKPGWATLVVTTGLALVGAGWFAAWALTERQLAEKEKGQRIEQQTVAKEMTRLRGIAETRRQEAVEQRALAREGLYVAKMRRVGGAILQGYFTEAIELLEEWRPRLPDSEDYRSFEWYYNWRLCHRGRSFQGHSGYIAAVAFDPRGERLASSGGVWDDERREYVGGEVRVWDVRTGGEVLYVGGHRAIVNGVAFNADGSRLATASKDATVKVWDAATGKELFTLKGHKGEVHCVAWSRDGTLLAAGGADGTVKVWDSTGKERFTLRGHERGSVYGVAFSPDSKKLASAGWDSTARVWDTASGRELLVFKRHASGVSSVAYSPDGKKIVSAGWDESVKVWDADTGKEIISYEEHEGRVKSAAFSPDGNRIASASDSTVKIWDPTTGRDAFDLKGHSKQILSVAFNTTGTYLASGGNDKILKVWDCTAPQEDTPLTHGDVVSSLAFSPDGQRLASGGWDNAVRVWDVNSGQQSLPLCKHEAPVTSVAFSPDGLKFASGSSDNTVSIWNSRTGGRILSLVGHNGKVTGVAFSRDGTRLASGSGDNTVKVWDTATGRELFTLKGHSKSVTGVAFSSAAPVLASSSEDETVRLWDANTGAPLLSVSGLGSPVWCVAFSPDGRRVAAGCGRREPNRPGEIRLWDTMDGREITVIKDYRFLGVVSSLAFSSDGKRLASAHGQLFIVPVWDVDTGQQVLELQGHQNVVWSVTFSPDGKRLATAGLDFGIRVWDGSPLD